MSNRLPVRLRRLLGRRSRSTLPADVTPPAGSPRLPPLAFRLLRLVLLSFFRLFRSSGAWKEAVALATADPRVRQALGDPVAPGAWVGGRIHVVNGDRGEAAFVVPLHGPRGEASLRVQALKNRGVWSFQLLQAQVRGGACIDLLEAPASGTLPRATPGPPRLPGHRQR